MKNCNFVSLDQSIDQDVYLNLKAFYRKCGYKIKIIKEPINCDLLVVLRGFTEKTFSKITCNCHIYDYVKNGTDSSVFNFPNAKIIYLISLDTYRSKFFPSNVRLIFSPHPVVPEIWNNYQVKKRIIKAIHIGHKKNDKDPKDKIIKFFDRYIENNKVTVYGSGWEDKRGRLMKAISLYKANYLYKCSQIAFGCMYSFQRGKTISGRYWQAPINGCRLVVESLPKNFRPPGVIVLKNYNHVTNYTKYNNDKLLSDAQKFWNTRTQILAKKLGLEYEESIYSAKNDLFVFWLANSGRLLISKLFSQSLKNSLRKISKISD